ncbi:MAG: hypothetical protein AAFO81_10145 [Pseudomonadota bacterium]
MNKKTTIGISSLCLLAMAAGAAQAQSTLEYQLESGVAHSNNIDRDPDDGLDETAIIVGGGLNFTNETRRTDFGVISSLEHRIFTKDSNDDETLLSLTGNFDFDIVERILSWRTTDTFGQVLQDPLAPSNPLNREDVNVFSTGPVLNIPLNSTNRIQVAATYRDVSFEESPQNNDALSGQISYQRQINANRRFAVNLTSQALDFDRAIDPDFDRNAATVSFNSQTSRSNLSIELGYNEVSFGSNLEDSDGSLVRINWNRDLTNRLSMNVSLNQELSDTGQLFDQFANERNVNSIGENFGEADADADAIEQGRASFGLASDQRNGRVFVTANLLDIDFRNSNDRDRKAITLVAGATREFAGGWDVVVNASINSSEFADGRDDDNLQIRFGVSKRLTRTLSLNASVAHVERDSTAGNFSYDEDTARLTLLWQPQRTRGGT